jgi:hypothetical protein
MGTQSSPEEQDWEATKVEKVMYNLISGIGKVKSGDYGSGKDQCASRSAILKCEGSLIERIGGWQGRGKGVIYCSISKEFRGYGDCSEDTHRNSSLKSRAMFNMPHYQATMCSPSFNAGIRVIYATFLYQIPLAFKYLYTKK